MIYTIFLAEIREKNEKKHISKVLRNNKHEVNYKKNKIKRKKDTIASVRDLLREYEVEQK